MYARPWLLEKVTEKDRNGFYLGEVAEASSIPFTIQSSKDNDRTDL